jgi:hypothetical protein
MKNKVVLLTGVAVGYVLGTRAGREQYEKIRSQARSLWGDPRVQEQVSHVQQAVKEQVPVVQEKVGEAARKATDRTSGSESGSAGSGIGDPGRTSGYRTDPNLNESGGGI